MTTSNEIRDALATNAQQLAQAQQDASLFARLKQAAADAATLSKHGDDLSARLADAVAEEARIEREAEEARYRSIQITTAPGRDRSNESVLGTTITIDWEERRWDGHAAVWTPCQMTDFMALPPVLFRMIMEADPVILPAIITDLAPGDKDAAMERYLVARRRGYLAG